MNIYAIILAAGKGQRMGSTLPKCAHKIIDKPMVEYVADALLANEIKDICTVVGYQKEVILEILEKKSSFATQIEQSGTANAVSSCAKFMSEKEGITLIAIGDMPFISKETYKELLDNHIKNKSDLTVLTTIHKDPTGYGRIIRDSKGQVMAIVEDRDCIKEQKNIKEINASVYVVDNQKLFTYLKKVKNDNLQGEYYLTDLVKLFYNDNLKVSTYIVDDYDEISGVNDQAQLMSLEKMFQKKIIDKHLINGIVIKDIENVKIGMDVIIEQDVAIMENSSIIGKSFISKGAFIGPNAIVEDSFIGENAKVFNTTVKNTKVEASKIVGV